jgi:arsenate reductase-like glutaredoxin family protein
MGRYVRASRVELCGGRDVCPVLHAHILLYSISQYSPVSKHVKKFVSDSETAILKLIIESCHSWREAASRILALSLLPSSSVILLQMSAGIIHSHLIVYPGNLHSNPYQRMATVSVPMIMMKTIGISSGNYRKRGQSTYDLHFVRAS